MSLLTDFDELQEKNAALRARIRTLEGVVQDFAENGVRFDLNPTVRMGIETFVHMDYLAYIKRIDESVRERAKVALDTAEERP